MTTESSPEPVVAGAAMRQVLDAARDVAATPTTVLLSGESGTGKEVLARFLHRHSKRSGAYVAVNCAALPGELLESELFGHEKGAFTGAGERRVGRVEQAHGGTLLLDEVSELPLGLQPKLLRVLQERELDRVGGARPVKVDVRVIATTNRELSVMVKRGEFRADLYYRLNVFPIELPPLRARRDELSALAAHLLERATSVLGRKAKTLSPAALRCLLDHDFPGNVRELANLLERALVRARGTVIEPQDLGLTFTSAGWRANFPTAEAPEGQPADALFPAHLPLNLQLLEQLATAEALRRSNGNRTQAARLLGISLRTLRYRLNEGAPEARASQLPASNWGLT